MKLAVVHKAFANEKAEAVVTAEQRRGNASMPEPSDELAQQQSANISTIQKARNATMVQQARAQQKVESVKAAAETKAMIQKAAQKSAGLNKATAERKRVNTTTVEKAQTATMTDSLKAGGLNPVWAWAWVAAKEEPQNSTFIEKVAPKKAKPTTAVMQQQMMTATSSQIEKVHAQQKVDSTKVVAEKKAEKLSMFTLTQKVRNAPIIRRVLAQKPAEPATTAQDSVTMGQNSRAPNRKKLLKARMVQNTGSAALIQKAQPHQKAEPTKAMADHQPRNATTPALVDADEALSILNFWAFA